MIGKLNHVAIAVPDLEAARAFYRDVLGASVSEIVDQPEHGVRTVFVELPNTKIELLGVLGDASPIAGFLARNPSGESTTCASKSKTSALLAISCGHVACGCWGRGAQDRCPRQACALPAPQGRLRHAPGARAGVSVSEYEAVRGHRRLFGRLVAHPLHGPAVGGSTTG